MKVNDFRLSAIWVEAFPEQLGNTDQGRLGPLVRASDYATLFNGLLTTDADPLVTLPWFRTAGQKYPAYNGYWNDYILRELGDHGGGDPGTKAWRSAAPLRHKANIARIKRPDRCFVEGWYWPHGVALTVTLWCRRPLDADQLVAEASGFLGGGLRVAWPDGHEIDGKLNDLADGTLDQLRTAGFGPIEAGFRPPPMRVLTVVDAKFEPTDKDQEAATKALLNAGISAAGGNPNGKIETDRDVYGFSRGRLVWRPDRSLAGGGDVHTLGCLHRNITMATTQVASLLRAAEGLSAVLENGGRLAARVDPYAHVVGGTLGRIYGGSKTYRQGCLRSQIRAANETGRIDALRQACELGPLFDPPPKEGGPAAREA
jgi:hypothetical protein